MGCAIVQVLQLWQSSMYLSGAVAGMFASQSMPACVNMARGLLPDACPYLCASATAEALLFPRLPSNGSSARIMHLLLTGGHAIHAVQPASSNILNPTNHSSSSLHAPYFKILQVLQVCTKQSTAKLPSQAAGATHYRSCGYLGQQQIRQEGDDDGWRGCLCAGLTPAGGSA